MFKRRGKLFEIEKDSTFAYRVLALSLPSALVFIMMVALHLLPAGIAVLAYAAIALFNIVWLFPMTFELQQIRKYIFKLSNDGDLEQPDFETTESETQEIVNAVNEMHRFWSSKAEQLKAQTISDTAVLDTLPDPILMIDRKGNILGANLSARNLLGRNINKQQVEKVFNSNNFINAVNKILQQQSESENLIFYLGDDKNKKLGPRKLYAHIKRLPWVSKGHAVAVISLYDFSKVERIEKMQSDFVANASHELRTPLSIISGFIETLQTTAKDDPEASKMFLNIMSQQANYMSLLIENLLSLSKIELNQDLPPNEKIDLPLLVEDVADALQLKAKAKGMSFCLEQHGELPQIFADEAQIRQLLQNLCDNAIKYGNPDSAIDIKIRQVSKIPQSKSFEVAKGPALAIAVHNFGEPIAAEYLSRLTERFYRLQTHKDKNIKGSGLGLAIVKHILIRHQGNLRVKPDESGNTFTIYLPLRQNTDDRGD